MKKTVVLLCAFLVSLSVLFAADSSVASISLMIDSDLSANYDSISKESATLTDFEIMSLYAMHEDSPTVPFLVNFLVGAGIGSFIQGDMKGGYTGLITDIVALGMYSVGYVQVFTAALDNEISEGGSMLVLLGAGVMLGSKIYQSIRPFSYSKEYNRRLNSSLMGKAEIFVTPVITAVNNQRTLGMVGKISF